MRTSGGEQLEQHVDQADHHQCAVQNIPAVLEIGAGPDQAAVRNHL